MMKRKELFYLMRPLIDKLYSFAFILIPDDLQAEQLVIDSLNALLIQQKNKRLIQKIDFSQKKNILLHRRRLFKEVLKCMFDIGPRRWAEFRELNASGPNLNESLFYSLEAKSRFVIALRYQEQFRMEEIEDIVQLPRYEVIEKIHNARFLLLKDFKRPEQN